MKKFETKVIALLLVIGSPTLSFASTTEVQTRQRGPVSCKETERLATEDLFSQCQTLGKRDVTDVKFHNCVPDGDDGGYVNHFLVDATGICIE